MSKKENTIYIIIVIVLVILVGYFAYVRNGGGTQTAGEKTVGDATVASSTTPTSAVGAEVLGDSSYGIRPVATGVETTSYKAPLILLGDKGVKGKEVGCGDSLVSVTITGPKVPAVLNQTYRELFNMGEAVGMSGVTYRNAVSLGDLDFIEAKIDAGVASVYLGGKLATETCDNARQKAQIESTALSFPIVKKVITYLDGKVVTWGK